MPIDSTRLLPDHQQRQCRIAVVGAGALGSEVCRLLASLSFENVTVIDPDVVEARNIPLSILFQDAHRAGDILGTPKAQVVADYAAAAHAKRLNWSVLHAEIADVGLARLTGVELLISCTDSTLARIETAWVARTLRIPMLDGGIHPHSIPQGRVTFFSSREGSACYLCGLSAHRRAEILAYALSRSLGCAALPDFPSMSGDCAIIPAVAALMLQTLKENWEESFAQILHASASPERIALPISASCPWHTLPSVASLVPIPPDQPIRAALLGRMPLLVELPWPLCVSATCRSCGFLSYPYKRTAHVRRSAVCPRCHQVATLEPLETLESLTAGHPAATKTTRELGLPEDQLFLFRRPLSQKMEIQEQGEQIGR